MILGRFPKDPSIASRIQSDFFEKFFKNHSVALVVTTANSCLNFPQVGLTIHRFIR